MLSTPNFPVLTNNSVTVVQKNLLPSNNQRQWINILPRNFETYNFKADALAVSCAVHRLRKEKNINLSLTDGNIEVGQQDLELADNIREFYGKKLVMLQLKHSQISKFRSDLAKFISSPGLELSEKSLGLVYRLPEFYNYDKNLDSLVENVFTEKVTRKIAKEYLTGRNSYALRPVAKLFRTIRGCKLWQYWHILDNTHYAALINVQYDNPLLGIWDKVFDSGVEFQVKGRLSLQNIDGFRYFFVHNWQMQNNVRLV